VFINNNNTGFLPVYSWDVSFKQKKVSDCFKNKYLNQINPRIDGEKAP
jgi:hypothetical protein